MSKLVILISLVILAFSSVKAVEYEDIVIFRGLDGNLTEESLRNLEVLKQEARGRGSVKIWIMLDIEYEFDADKRTAAVKLSEATNKSSMLSSVIQPSKGMELQPVPRGLDEAPGAMVIVTERGLGALARDARVKHITYHP